MRNDVSGWRMEIGSSYAKENLATLAEMHPTPLA